MKRLSVLFIALSILLAGCMQAPTHTQNAFEYKGAYVGDNTAVINIAQRLPMNDCYKSIELQTTARPYGLTVRYEAPEMDRIEQEQLAIRNAATYFTLIRNAEIVRFAFPNRTYAFSRAEMEAWFDIDFSKIKWENDLKERLDEKIGSEQQTEEYFKRI